MITKTPAPEFSRPFAVDRLGAAAVTETVRATSDERAALAKRLRVRAVDDLSATVKLERRPGDLVHVSGRLEADVTQTCVLTLADFPTHVEDSFSVDFGDGPPDPSAELSIDIDYDPPEPIEAGSIDIGELVAQYLSLALDPHPRAPGAVLDPILADPDAEERLPFAALRQLKRPT